MFVIPDPVVSGLVSFLSGAVIGAGATGLWRRNRSAPAAHATDLQETWEEAGAARRRAASAAAVAMVLAGLTFMLALGNLFPRRARPFGPAVEPALSTPSDPGSLLRAKVREVMVLRGDFEARDPGWSLLVRQQGLRLAAEIAALDPQQLRPAQRILQHEYGGWALLMVARTFGSEEPEAGTEAQTIKYATAALEEFDVSLGLMREVVRRFQAGTADRETPAVYDWMTGPSDDLERTHWLRAVALAVIARAGGDHTKADVRIELKEISPAYLLQHPPDKNPDLRWALDG